MQRVSLCMIARDEETNLPACLGGVAGLVHEMVLVDTGSSDRTRATAARLGARVFDTPWADDFAAARNETLRHATGDWIFWLDADDRIDDANRARLAKLFAGLGSEKVAYKIWCLCPPRLMIRHVRLFPNHTGARWRHRVHERIEPDLVSRGIEVRQSDVVIEHAGYLDGDLVARKFERNLRLLQLEHAEHPDDPFILFKLGQSYHSQGEATRALALLQRSLELYDVVGPTPGAEHYLALVQLYLQQGHSDPALTVCRAGLAHHPDDGDLLYQQATLLRVCGDVGAAEAHLRGLLEGLERGPYVSTDRDVLCCNARHDLAVLYRSQERAADAERHWRLVVAGRPDYIQAWMGLADLWLAQGRLDEVERAARLLEAQAGLPAEAAVLRARARLAQRDFTSARDLLTQTIIHYPDAFWPRVALGHVLLQEGWDPAAAERALQDVLTRSPDYAPARQQLAALYRQQGRAAPP